MVPRWKKASLALGVTALFALLALQLVAFRRQSEPPAEVALLKSPDAQVRWNAALNLGARRERAAVPALCEALEDPHPNVSTLAAWALGRVGDPTAAPALSRYLARSIDRNPLLLPQLALSSLARLKDPSAMPVLVQVLTVAADTGDREQALEALASLEGVDVTPILAGLARDPDENIRQMALERLGRRPTDLSVQTLVASASDPEADIRRTVAFALRFTGDEGRPALEALTRDEDPEVARQAHASLETRNAVYEDEAGDEEVDLEVAEPLALDFPDLNYANIEDYEPEFEAPIGMALGGRLSVSELLATLKEGDRREVGNAILHLGNRGRLPDEAVQALAGLLRHRDPGVRWKASKALGKVNAVKAVPALLAAADDPDKDVREDVVEALGRIDGAADNPKVMAVLTAAMDDPWLPVRLAAARELSGVPGDPARKLLLKGLQDRDGLVRIVSARSLALRRDAEAEAALERLCTDPDLRVRFFARRPI